MKAGDVFFNVLFDNIFRSFLSLFVGSGKDVGGVVGGLIYIRERPFSIFLLTFSFFCSPFFVSFFCVPVLLFLLVLFVGGGVFFILCGAPIVLV